MNDKDGKVPEPIWRKLIMAPGRAIVAPFKGADPVAREFAAAFVAHAVWFLALVAAGLWWLMG